MSENFITEYTHEYETADRKVRRTWKFSYPVSPESIEFIENCIVVKSPVMPPEPPPTRRSTE